MEKSIRTNIYELFYSNKDCDLAELLNNSSFDELLEINLNNDSFRQVYHVEGKYYVPGIVVTYTEIYDFAREHVVHPDDKKIYERLMNPIGMLDRLKKSKIPNFDYAHFRYKLLDGSYRYVEQCIITGKENGIPEGIVKMYVFDIHNLISRQLGIINESHSGYNSNRNSLTGLLVEQAFWSEAQKKVNNVQDTSYALISTDIEHFKFFDDWYGRETGDYLLAKIGAILKENDEKNGSLSGYFGSDDFVILLPFNMDKIQELYEKFRDVIISFGLSVGFMPAFGVAIIEEDMLLLDAFDRATIAASKAKKDIRNRICVYDSEMHFQAENEYRILNEAMSALKSDEFTFYLQPQCRISTGKIVGAESLARWIKPDGSIIPPKDFIPVLEKYGFITDLDQVLWEKVCKWLRGWIDSGHKPVPISLNVSRADIFTIDIHKFFAELTKKYNLPHDVLKIEITESAYTETTSLIGELVKNLRNDGFVVLMDDFGSGYSSLNMLSNLKVDAIKLDANFLHISGADYEKGIHILESVVNMAKQINIPIIVEGVETKEQTDFLQSLGCRYVQGYYFYKPMSISKFEELTKDASIIDDRGFVAKLNEQFRIREFLDENIYSDSMLNSILGSVAIYSLHGKHVDIVRYNQQFFESVNVPEFSERLENIENFTLEEDRPKMFAAMHMAKKNKLNGGADIFRFYRTDGTFSSFYIHFFYLGKKEGTDRFYGSAINFTELQDLREEKDLVCKYSTDNLIFIKKINGKWKYTVVAHGLEVVFGLSAKELEEEMNSGKFALRVKDKKELDSFMKETEVHFKNRENFKKTLYLRAINDKNIKLDLDFICVCSSTSNIDYILRPKIAE